MALGDGRLAPCVRAHGWHVVGIETQRQRGHTYAHCFLIREHTAGQEVGACPRDKQGASVLASAALTASASVALLPVA